MSALAYCEAATNDCHMGRGVCECHGDEAGVENTRSAKKLATVKQYVLQLVASEAADLLIDLAQESVGAVGANDCRFGGNSISLAQEKRRRRIQITNLSTGQQAARECNGR